MVRAKNSLPAAQPLPIRADRPDLSSVLPTPYFDESAEEDERSEREIEDEDEEEGEGEREDENGRGSLSRHRTDEDDALPAGKWREKDKKIFKSLRRFAASLLSRASLSPHWEEEQLVDLLDLLRRELGLDEDALFKLVDRAELSLSPSLLVSLSERGVRFSTTKALSALLRAAQSMDRFVVFVSQAIEYDLFDLEERVGGEGASEEERERVGETEKSVLELVCTFPLHAMDVNLKRRYAAAICGALPHKTLCGRALSYFAQSFANERESAKLVLDIVTLESVRDVAGTLRSLVDVLRPTALRDEVQLLLGEECNLDADGEIADSDADSDGNLRGFIAGSDDSGSDINSGSDSGSESGSESESESESETDSDEEEDEVQSVVESVSESINKRVSENERVSDDESESRAKREKAKKREEKKKSSSRDRVVAPRKSLAVALADTDESERESEKEKESESETEREKTANKKPKAQHDKAARKRERETHDVVDLTSPAEKPRQRRRKIVLDSDEEFDE